MRIGNQAPRLRSVPAYTSTLGHEAVDLSAAAGQTLDPWQAETVCDILGIQDDGRWAAFETCTIAQRQQGKGGVIETIELAGLFLFGERLILHSAHEYKTAQEAFLRIKSLIDGCADLSRYVKAIREANGEQQVILMSGARLRFLARSKGSGRGFSCDRKIADEAYAETLTQLAAVLPTMSARPNPQINHFSTVPDPETMPDPQEAVLPAIHDRALEAVRTGVPGRLAYHDWSMKPGEDPSDPEVWYACNPALGIRITEDYVRSELAALGPEKFSVERLGAWPVAKAEQWKVIPKLDWETAKKTDFAHPSPVAFAVALSTDRQWTTIAAAGPIGDGLVGIAIADRREGTGWVTDRLLDLIARWKPVAVVIDEGSPAKSIADAAVEAGIELTPISTRAVAGAAGALYDGIAGRPARDPATGEFGRDPRVIRHRDQSELNTAVAGAMKRQLAAAWAWDQMAATVDITPIIACSNALWGYTTRTASQPFFGAWR
ncbi:MAG: hypothetical protein V4515_14845 [Chloroflexota bacterium]